LCIRCAALESGLAMRHLPLLPLMRAVFVCGYRAPRWNGASWSPMVSAGVLSRGSGLFCRDHTW
jgi:hypothetical protein